MTIFAYRTTIVVAAFILEAESYLDYLDHDIVVKRKPTPRKFRRGQRRISHF